MRIYSDIRMWFFCLKKGTVRIGLTAQRSIKKAFSSKCTKTATNNVSADNAINSEYSKLSKKDYFLFAALQLAGQMVVS